MSLKRKITFATHNAKHGVGQAAKVLGEYREVGLEVNGLEETRHDSQSLFKPAGYVVYSSGLVVREKINRAVVRLPEFINERLLKMTLELRGRAIALTFIDTYCVKC